MPPLDVDAPEIRLPDQLDEIDGLIIPRGESATVVQLIDIYGSCGSLRQRSRQDIPIWGACTGCLHGMPVFECLRVDACV